LSIRKPKPSPERIHPEPADSPESGQVAIGLLVILALLMFAGLALAVDLANMWFHRQTTQSAVDAACQAGAMDMLASSSGVQLNSMGFTPGTASSCASSPSATMCAYAKFNGYDGAGPQPSSNTNSAWSTVSWTFPSSVSGATAPPSSITTAPYMQVSIVENVKTFFIGLFTNSQYQKVSSTATCGIAQIKEAAPIIVLNPTISGALSYNGGPTVTIVGGPQRSVQVNSTSPLAIVCSGTTSVINTSKAGPASTGGDIAVVSSETQAQYGCGTTGFNGGTTGNWRSSVLPVPDPYAAVAAPTSVKAVTPITNNGGTGYVLVNHGIDGCPNQTSGCAEYGPGYYPNGIPLPSNGPTLIFLPGVYYVNATLSVKGQNTLRVALPCWSSYTSGYSASACSSVSSANGLKYSQTQGVMFYFSNTATYTAGGGGAGQDIIDNVPSTTLTCDGSSPGSSLGVPAAVSGNVLWAQCTQNATYWDSGGDTTDSQGNPGNRGILFFQDHGDTTSPSFAGGAGLAYAGSLYFHSNSYADVLGLTGGGGTGTFILGEIVADQITLTGNGAIGMQLNSAPSTYMLKAAAFQ
jgi:hypothetical protein